MLQKQSISRDQIFYIIIAISVITLIAISFSMASDGRIGTLSSIIPGQAAASEAMSGSVRAQQAESARWTAHASEYFNLYGSTTWVRAGLSPALQVEADRLTGIANEVFNLYGSTARINAGLSPAMQVEADRLTGVAAEAFNLYGSTARVNAGLSPAMQVEADRLTGVAAEAFNLYGSTGRVNAGRDRQRGLQLPWQHSTHQCRPITRHAGRGRSTDGGRQ
jgi:hypothetical protein